MHQRLLRTYYVLCRFLVIDDLVTLVSYARKKFYDIGHRGLKYDLQKVNDSFSDIFTVLENVILFYSSDGTKILDPYARKNI